MTAKNPKLHEVVPARKTVKARSYSQLTGLHKKAQKGDLYNGLNREFKPLDDDGETFPPESKKVTVSADDVLKQVAKIMAPAMDIEATVECGNASGIAKATVVVDGQTILSDVPATLLLYVEKQLSDLRTFLDKMPVLDEAKDWTKDPNSKVFRSETAVTHKTKKVQKPIVLYDATEEHPAQTQLITEDIIIGHWHTTYLSGAMPIPEKEAVLERLEKLLYAVKKARSEANDVRVERQEIAGAFFGYLFG
jgi:hypothetical protein